MRLCCDRTGFPLLRLDALGLEVGLLPCAKVQFEAFLAEPDERFGDAWYEAVLAVNPRDGWRLPPAAEERLFLTGVLPDEALAFLRWLGPGFDLPSVQEWLAVDALLRDRRLDGDALERGLADCDEAARALVDRIGRAPRVWWRREPARPPRTWGELARTQGLLVEWVRDGDEFGGLGSPPDALWRHVFQPRTPGDVVRPFAGRRLPFLGFRPVRRR